eukprot:CAMPEP_0170074218 /NCGR_PEP_ID=MMETSP0019_2-20121128/11540_1 /TAXON_ID=98059 /ORGANISM="Dinobryon sp., Strain UTEXLB2267" /LENGTH=171 /DNA_ID=CAMNT_0010284337 /DNA_START=358 /DNA_END=870 /DNA_ORIENTATION=+
MPYELYSTNDEYIHSIVFCFNDSDCCIDTWNSSEEIAGEECGTPGFNLSKAYFNELYQLMTSTSTPIVFCFNGSDCIDAWNALEEITGEECGTPGFIQGHPVVVLYCRSEDMIRWRSDQESVIEKVHRQAAEESAESLRIAAEKSRIAAEESRIAAEEARIAAEESAKREA